jgi:hypothetical protein
MRRYDDRLIQIAQVVGPRQITEADVVTSPAWRQLEALLAAALKPYPEASQAVVDHVRAYYEGAGVKQRPRR